MNDGPQSSDLAALHDRFARTMLEVDTMIDHLDDELSQANESWTSKGAHEFNDAWHNGFKPSLAKFCQALALAGNDIAFQHNQPVDDATEAGQQGPKLDELSSPR